MKLCAVTFSAHDLLPLAFLWLNWCSVRTALSNTSVALPHFLMCLSRSFVIVYPHMSLPNTLVSLSSDNVWG